MGRILRVAGIAGAMIFSLPAFLFAGTFTAFGPETYQRGIGAPVPVTNTFSVLNSNTTYTFRIHNGGLVDGEFEKVSSSTLN